MNIPDYISPIVGYRVWQWDRLGLKSLNDEPWFPGLELEANASRCGQRHRAPTNLCTCGIYAAKDFAHLRRIGYLGYGVHGEVYLWGKVVEHYLGWRAQYAYPKSLVLPTNTLPFRMSEVESRLETLIAYGPELSIAAPRGAFAEREGGIRLWSKESGFDMAGFDWLIEPRKAWYSRQLQHPTLSNGDRVAVLGQGIGVVAHADDNNVHVRMWNRFMLRIDRKQVVWSRRNWRWEADDTEDFVRGISGEGGSNGRAQ